MQKNHKELSQLYSLSGTFTLALRLVVGWTYFSAFWHILHTAQQVLQVSYFVKRHGDYHIHKHSYRKYLFRLLTGLFARLLALQIFPRQDQLPFNLRIDCYRCVQLSYGTTEFAVSFRRIICVLQTHCKILNQYSNT